MKTTYEQVTKTVTKAGKCPVCGKVTRRSRTFARTVNPFNRIEDRSRPKTRREVLADVARDVHQWQQEADLRHERCKPEREQG